jgi:hypothetical protein
MSNKKEDFSPLFLWHQIPFKQKTIVIIIFILIVTLSFGLGFTAAEKEDRAEIIINQCEER